MSLQATPWSRFAESKTLTSEGLYWWSLLENARHATADSFRLVLLEAALAFDGGIPLSVVCAMGQSAQRLGARWRR